MEDRPAPPAGMTPLRKQWLLVGTTFVLVSVMEWVSVSWLAETRGLEGSHPFDLLSGVLVWLAQGIWVTMDCSRRERPLGRWRFMTFLLGGIGISIYLGYEYKLRAFYLIPLTLLLYAFSLGAPWLAYALGAFD